MYAFVKTQLVKSVGVESQALRTQPIAKPAQSESAGRRFLTILMYALSGMNS